MNSALQPDKPKPGSSDSLAQRCATMPSDSARSVLMFVNARAGSAGGSGPAGQTEAALRECGFEVVRVDHFDELGPTAKRLQETGQLRAAVAVGGDGTVGALLNATPPGTPLAVVPAGTENLLAKYLGTPRQSGDVAAMIQQGVVVSLDAGEANGRLFALMISAGFDAEVIHRVHNHRQGNITHLAYAWPILDSVRRYRFPPVQVTWQNAAGEPREVVGRWVFGVNLPRYAQGIPIVPHAVGTDGLLDLCVLKKGYAIAGIWYLWNIFRRRHTKLPSVTSETCQSCTLTPTKDKPIPYQLDGDPGGFLPVEVKIVPNRLTLLVSPAVATQLGFAVEEANTLTTSH